MGKVNSTKTLIFLIGVLLVSIGTLLPWVDTIFISIRIRGTSTWEGYIVFALLIISICFFFLVKKEKLASSVLVVSGIISIIIVFPPRILVSNPIVSYGIGTYVTLLGSIFIVITGIIGLLKENKDKKRDYPFEDH